MNELLARGKLDAAEYDFHVDVGVLAANI